MKSNTRFKKNTKGIECLNCKQPISTADNFCSNCGQVNDTKPLSLKQYVNQLLGGFFAFDTRTINTLIPLLTKPGKITKEYVEGRRMKYVNPFQLYLHASIIFFLVTGIFISIDNYRDLANTKQEFTNNETDNDSFMDGFVEGLTKNDEINKKINENAIKFVSNKEFIQLVSDTILNKTEKNKKVNRRFTIQIKSFYDSIAQDTLFKTSRFSKYKTFRKEYLKIAVSELKSNNIEISLNENKPFSNNTIKTSSPWLKKYTRFYNAKSTNAFKALDSLGYERNEKNVFFFTKIKEFKNATSDGGNAESSFISNMISKASIVMFFMLPLFTLFLSLLYIRNKNSYTEHLIFVFNVQTVFFLLLLTGIIIDRILDTDYGSMFFVIGFLLYLYKAMRKFYNQGRTKTIIKFLALNFVYFLLAVFGLMAVTFLAIFI